MNAAVAATTANLTMPVVSIAFMVVSFGVADFMQPRYEGLGVASARRVKEGVSAG
jgi:hypothetical protein